MPERIHFLQIKQSPTPPDKEKSCVMTSKWRLVNRRELYDIKTDPGQKYDLADNHPEVVAELKAAHDAWWEEMTPYFEDPCAIALGNPAENPTTICAMDVMGDVAWQQAHVLAAVKSSGNWHVNVEAPGKYRFALRRWPEELPIPMEDNVSNEFAKTVVYPNSDRKNIVPDTAKLTIFGKSYEQQAEPGAEEVAFEIDIQDAGKTMLECSFTDIEGETYGAYYVVIEKL